MPYVNLRKLISLCLILLFQNMGLINTSLAGILAHNMNSMNGSYCVFSLYDLTLKVPQPKINKIYSSDISRNVPNQLGRRMGKMFPVLKSLPCSIKLISFKRQPVLRFMNF